MEKPRPSLRKAGQLPKSAFGGCICSLSVGPIDTVCTMPTKVQSWGPEGPKGSAAVLLWRPRHSYRGHADDIGCNNGGAPT